MNWMTLEHCLMQCTKEVDKYSKTQRLKMNVVWSVIILLSIGLGGTAYVIYQIMRDAYLEMGSEDDDK